MSRYAPGTPESVMQAQDEKFYGKPLGNKGQSINAFRDAAFGQPLRPKMTGGPGAPRLKRMSDAPISEDERNTINRMIGTGGRPSPEMTAGPGAPPPVLRGRQLPPMSTDGGTGGGMGNVLDRMGGMGRGKAIPAVQPMIGTGGRPSPEMTGGPGAPPPMPAGGGMGTQPMGGMGTPPIGAPNPAMMKKGGAVKAKAPAKGGSVSKVSSASSRADGCAIKGKTKGRFV